MGAVGMQCLTRVHVEGNWPVGRTVAWACFTRRALLLHGLGPITPFNVFPNIQIAFPLCNSISTPSRFPKLFKLFQ
jgi:hypothetical protein